MVNLIEFIDRSSGKYIVLFGEVVTPSPFAPLNFFIQNGTGKMTVVREACVKVCEPSAVTILYVGHLF